MIHDGRSGQCNPAYATIAAKANCAPSTVGMAIRALELVGIIRVVNRLVRERSRERDLFGGWSYTWRLLRTSNCYIFRDPKTEQRRGIPTKTEFRSGPPDKDLNPARVAKTCGHVATPELPERLCIALGRLRDAIRE